MWIATPGWAARNSASRPNRSKRTGRIDAADPQLPAQQAGNLLQFALYAFDLGQHSLRVPENHLALRREIDAAAGAAKHLDPKLLLEAADLL